jgi:hypothetical protein
MYQVMCRHINHNNLGSYFRILVYMAHLSRHKSELIVAAEIYRLTSSASASELGLSVEDWHRFHQRAHQIIMGELQSLPTNCAYQWELWQLSININSTVH